jgi:hypothetical protein
MDAIDEFLHGLALVRLPKQAALLDDWRFERPIRRDAQAWYGIELQLSRARRCLNLPEDACASPLCERSMPRTMPPNSEAARTFPRRAVVKFG